MMKQKPPFDGHITRQAVIQVGAGRGFIIEIAEPTPNYRKARARGLRLRRWHMTRLVVTAAHCLPKLPPACPSAFTEEKTYPDLLGPFAVPKPCVMAECLFVDPVADIAILGAPDGQFYSADEHDAYYALTEDARVLRVGEIVDHTKGWLLSIDGRWSQCTLEVFPRGLAIREATGGLEGGMSGSPILADDGRAIGMINEGGSMPSMATKLTACLPGWLLRWGVAQGELAQDGDGERRHV